MSETSVSFGEGLIPIFSKQGDIPPDFKRVIRLFLDGKPIFIPGDVIEYKDGSVVYEPYELGGASKYKANLVEGNTLFNFILNQEVCDAIQTGGTTMNHPAIESYIKAFPSCATLIKHCLEVNYDTNRVLSDDIEVLD
jgi:signal peptidase I